MVDVINSLKKFILVLVILVIMAFGIVYLFDALIAAPTKLSALLEQTVRTVIVLIFGSIIILFIRRSKPLISKQVGPHPATVFQFFMLLIAVVIIAFAILRTFEVEATTYSVVSIIVGLVISTFVGNILAGTLVLVTNPFREGDTVLINNVPGKVVEITSLVSRIRTDLGGEIVIPNNAIVQGGVIVTKFSAETGILERRLPYSLGDRVYTTYMSAEGTVIELSPLYTKIRLDSGRELTFLNSSVLTGTVAVARVR